MTVITQVIARSVSDEAIPHDICRGGVTPPLQGSWITFKRKLYKEERRVKEWGPLLHHQ